MLNNRELSWLDFNDRVLQEAQDKSVPLMQRLRFLGIYSNNQDEFIRVRVANLIRFAQVKGASSAPKLTGDYTPKELLPLVNERMFESQGRYDSTYKEVIANMEQNNIYVIDESQLNNEQKVFCRNYYFNTISNRLVPLIVRKTIDMPFLPDGQIYLGVKMYSKGVKNIKYAIIQIPISKSSPRFVQLPSCNNRYDIIFLDDIIRYNLNEIFFMFNYDTIESYTFKIVRDAQMELDYDVSKSLMEKMEQGIEERQKGRAVRLVYDKEMPEDLLYLISSKLKIDTNTGLHAGGKYHQLRDLMKFPAIKPELENTNPKPLRHPLIEPCSSILKVIKNKDIFLNYPYHTFNHFIDCLREAAVDPKVKNIFITIYRSAESSKVINTLINAARNGKKVVVFLELMARFDEEQNLIYSELLQNEGVRVLHGVGGTIKVHSKLLLIERGEGSATNGYAYIGTGNFNEDTAKVYSDFGLFTCNKDIVSEVRKVFDILKLNVHKPHSFKHLLVAPYTMRSRFRLLIENEIKNAKAGKKASIKAKLNSLTDPATIKLLYKASQAGVDVKLIIRGACCLRPQVKGLSDNIRAISIVDRYLEHARLAIFHNGGEELCYIMSADWMTRNLDRRIEVGTPIYDKHIQQTIKDFFKIQWADNTKARELAYGAVNEYLHDNSNSTHRSQIELYDYYANKNYGGSNK